jgi:hypothetical protein
MRMTNDQPEADNDNGQKFYDEGRAYALQGHRRERLNPYRLDVEPVAFHSWIAGFRSVNSESKS